MVTEIIDKLFLELAQITKAKLIDCKHFASCVHCVSRQRTINQLKEDIERRQVERDYLEDKIELLKEALNKYGKHSTPEICCEASLKEGDKCTCGFEQALKG